MKSKIDASGIHFGYNEKNPVLKGVGVSIEKGDIVGILGPNGSGKTTMIKCLNKILEPEQGSILLNGDEIKKLKRQEVAKLVGYVPQNSGDLLEAPIVYEVVMMGRRPHMSWKLTEADEKIVWDTMEELNVAHMASQGFDQLSSGQLQRVLMARAIVQEAEIFLLDEPTSNLDIKYQLEVLDMVTDIVRRKEVSACLIVHDLDLALRYCNKIFMMNEGEIFMSGYAADVLSVETIGEVYGVDVHVEDLFGRKRIIVQ